MEVESQMRPTSRQMMPDEFEELFRIVWPPEVDKAFMDEDFKNWIDQGLQIAQQVKFQVGIFQNKNGPCGLLAAVNALLIKQLVFGQPTLLTENRTPSVEEVETNLLQSLATILFRTNAQAEFFQIVSRMDTTKPFSLISPDNIVIDIIEKELVFEFLKENKAQYLGAGGAVLFLYSLTFSRGLDNIQTDLKVGIYGTTLVVGDFGLCTQALVNLCTIGQALPGLDDEIMERYDGEIEIGSLTFEEVDNMTFASGYSVLADVLKHPKYPIWILHGGDHYTTLFSFDTNALAVGNPKKINGAQAYESNKCANDCGFYGNSEWYGYCKKCYDSLSEVTAKKSTERVSCVGNCSFFGNPATYNYCSVCYKNLSQAKIKELKDVENAQMEIEKALKATTRAQTLATLEKDYDVRFYHYNGLPPSGPHMASINVTRRTNLADFNVEQDKNIIKNVAMLVQRKWVATEGTDLAGDWMYEVALRFDKDNKPPQQVGPQLEKWRCNECVVNQLFGFNEAQSDICGVCFKSINEVGTTIWVTYNQLNSLLKREVDTNYQPKIVSLLHTRWPKTTVEFGGQKPPTI